MKLPPIPIFNNEVEVQFWYTQIICNLLKCRFDARFKTDGIYQRDGIKILAEYKFGGSLRDQDFLISCIGQVLCYIKKIEDAGELLPNLIFIANEKEFCLFDSTIISDYLNLVDSSMTPSSIFSNTPDFLTESIGTNLKVHINNIENLPIISTMLSSYNGKSGGLKMTINNNNIVSIFGNFVTSNIVKDKLDANEEVQLFASIIFGECNDIKGKPDQIVTPLSKQQLVNINRHEYDSFLKTIKSINRPSSKDEIVSQSDRLINEVSRRFHGEFYTPKIWVDEAHKMIVNEFSQDCYNEYVWWDPCCGVGNLTRDYKFKELYCSTLHQVDIDIMNQRDYNPEAVKFQYDFLNDDVYPEGFVGLEQDKLERLASGLVQAFKDNRKIMIIMNPPYGETSIFNKHALKDSKTILSNLMKTYKFRYESKQLYTQFIFRVLLLKRKYKTKNMNICIFNPANLLSMASYQKMREIFFNSFSYFDGFMFNLKYFSDTAGDDAVLFDIFKSGHDGNNIFPHKIKDVNKNGNVIDKGIKNIYFLPEKFLCKNWARPSKNLDKIEMPSLSSALKIKTEKVKYIDKNFLGFVEPSRKVYDVYNISILSSIFSTPSGYVINEENFYKSIATFSSQRMTIPHWTNKQDEFSFPNENHREYKKWNFDVIVYSLFNSQSGQSSIRQINLQNKVINIKNEFFWLSNEQMMELADSHGFTEMYRDAKIFNQDRFVYNELTKVHSQLSQDAKDILEKANELVIKTVDKRKQLHNLHPEWHLNAWDAGWYQIKLILKDSFKSDLKEFTELYKKFEDRMREGVYKFGFLK